MKAKERYFVCDFETDNSQEAINKKKTSVYLWDICEIKEDYPHVIGRSIFQFYQQLIKNGNNCVYYFHNLKFDGNFFVNMLYKLNFEYVEEIKFNNQFSTIINQMGEWYSITFKKRGVTVKIYDSFKLLPLSVKALALTFNLEIKKGDFDYSIKRCGEITQEEKEYIQNDTEIVARSLKQFLDFGLKGITLSSATFSYFKKKYLPNFKKVFPVLDLDVDSKIRKAYRGGFCCVNEKYQGQILNNIFVYDYNSLYPSMEIKHGYPCGVPKIYKGENFKEFKDDKLYIIHLLSFFNCKINIPFYFRKLFGISKSQYSFYNEGFEKENIYLTLQEFNFLKKYYNFINLEIIEVLEFDKIKGVFDDFVKECYEKKKKTKDGERLIYKLMLNSLTGKFASNPLRISKKPTLKYSNSGDEFLGYDETPLVYVDPIYTALSVFITSYGRIELFEAIEKVGFDKWVYSDTDSIHIVGDTDTLNIGNELFQWKCELSNGQGYFLRQKCYAERASKEDEWVYSVAGLPKESKIEDLVQFFKGKEKVKKKKLKSVENGAIIIEEDFLL